MSIGLSPPGNSNFPQSQPPLRLIVEQPGLLRTLAKAFIWVAMILLLLLTLGAFLAASIGALTLGQAGKDSNPVEEKYHSLSSSAINKVAIIDVSGAIIGSEGFVKWQMDRVRDDDNVKAIVLHVNSPGGTINGSDYIYRHLLKITEAKKIPLVVSMGALAASGGYYISMAVGNKEKTIYAEPTTWTGSIGVIIPHYDLVGLMDKVDVQDDSIVSHPLKQMLSPTKHLPGKYRDEEHAILQQLVDSSFGDFKAIILSGRPKLTADKLDALATGQIYTAKQAKEAGLVDEIGFLEDAIDRAMELASLNKTNTRVVKYTRPHGLIDIFGASESAQAQRGNARDLAAMLDMAAPRAWYLCTWVPGAMASEQAQ